jgi:hypothetical protein
MSEEAPTREELTEARERVKQQLTILESPARNRNPQLIAKLRTMLSEIDETLAELKD